MGKQTCRYSTIPRYSLRLYKEKNIRYPMEQVSNSDDSEAVFRAYLENRDCEHLAMIMVDGHHNMIGFHVVSAGGISGMVASVRDIIKHAIVGRASAFILGHNHPSGDPSPSPQDIEFTKQILTACDVMGIPCLDHLIISSGSKLGVFSFFQHKLLFNPDPSTGITPTKVIS